MSRPYINIPDILLNFIQKKYKIKPVIMERLIMLFEDDFSQVQLQDDLKND